jgi:hypothetical protein
VDVLQRSLKKIASSRDQGKLDHFVPANETKNPILEVKEAISIPVSDPKTSEADLAELYPQALEQLHDYASTIASMYHDNPFHNFEHASYVTLSAQKLLHRIVVSRQKESSDESETLKSQSSAYGTTDDPLTHFAVLFSTMIHDIDHSGVSNGQLIKEGAEVAKLYDNKSIAEQNSIDVAWDLLMEPSYEELRKCIFTTQEDYDRFHSLIVNAVIATDIFDKELKDFRNKRWEKAFREEVISSCSKSRQQL